MMNKQMTLMGCSFLLLMSTITQAEDTVEVTNESMQQTRTQTRSMSGDEDSAQRTQLQDRVQSMSDQDRALYQDLNGGGEGSGNMKGYGSGYDSRRNGSSSSSSSSSSRSSSGSGSRGRGR